MWENMKVNISGKIMFLVILTSFTPLMLYSTVSLNELNRLEGNIVSISNDITLDLLGNYTLDMINSTERRISGIIEEDFQILKTLANSMAKPLYEKDLDMLKWLEISVNLQNPSIGGIWVVNASNIIVSGGFHPYFPIGKDLSGDTFHQAMLSLINQGLNESNYPFVTFNPQSISEDEFGMGYNYPIFYNESYIGVLILTRSWDQFQDLVESAEIKGSADIIMINIFGDIIAGSYQNYSEPYSLNFFITNPEYNSTKTILNKSTDIQEGKIGDIDIIFCYKWIEVLNNTIPELQIESYIARRWAIISILPINEYLLPIQRIQSEVQRQVEISSITTLISILVLIIGGLVTLYYGTKRITLPLKHLIEATLQIGEGNREVTVPVESRDDIGKLAESFNKMASNLKQYTDNLKSIIGEKEILIKEVHHRVKNNLQIISAIAIMHEQYLDEKTRNIFKEFQDRIKVMAKIHETLYNSEDLGNLNVKNYITSLVEDLILSYKSFVENVNFVFKIEDFDINIRKAVYFGLLLNELISNAMKYAFPSKIDGRIIISARLLGDGSIILKVEDDGIGFPDNIDYLNPDTMGLKIVDTLTKQLKGIISLNRDEGTSWTIKFKG
jgi:two-component sensor histidine kinase